MNGAYLKHRLPAYLVNLSSLYYKMTNLSISLFVLIKIYYSVK